MLNQFILVVSVLMVLGLVVFLTTYELRRRKRTIRKPQSIHIIFRDPDALATGFTYSLTPQRGRGKSFGDWSFITDTGVETPPENRVAEMDEGKQGDTLAVTWKLRDGTDVAETTMVQASSISPLTVTLTKKRAVHFEQEGTSYTFPDGRARTDPDAISPRRFLGTFLVIGSVVTISAGIWLSHTAWFVAHAAKTPGRVVGLEQHSGRHGIFYCPVFAFADTAGVSHTQSSSTGSSPASYAVGEQLTVLYNPLAPEKAMIDSFSAIWSLPLLFTGLGLVFVIFSSFALFLMNRNKRIQ